MPPLLEPTPIGASDIFLAIQTKRAGKIKGEAVAPGHEEAIVVRAWRWGVSSASAVGRTQATARRAYTSLTVVKGLDSATTPLMSALATNDEIKEAKLSMRRAGAGMEDFFVITLKGARLVGIEHAANPEADATETLQIAFTQVEVEYRPQKATGSRAGSFVFNDEILPA
jgi:type VI secretion system secreted protein Hcp